MAREDTFCRLLLCPLWWDRIGSHYRSTSSLPVRFVAGAAQCAWFRIHNNRLYSWLARDWRQ